MKIFIITMIVIFACILIYNCIMAGIAVKRGIEGIAKDILIKYKNNWRNKNEEKRLING